MTYKFEENQETLNSNIILVGFMGAGKSAVGKVLSENLSIAFYDSDKIIETRVGMSVSDIFGRFGEKYFRNMESKVIRELLCQTSIIISTGGGAVTDRALLDYMIKHGVVVYLDASIDTIYNRLKGSTKNRPMLYNNNNLRKRMCDLYTQRRPLYNKAHYVIDTNNKSVHEVAKEIMVAIT